MRKRLFFVACTVLLGIGLGFSKWNTERDVSTQAKSEATPEHLNRVREQESINKAELNHKIAKLHIPFITNQGQSDESVKFYANTFGGTVFITRQGEIIYSLPKVENMEQMKRSAKEVVSSDLKPETRNPKSIKRLALKEEVVGGKVKEVKGEGEAVTKVSYFRRNDRTKWKSNIPTYDVVSLGEVYEGVELKLRAYGNNVEKLFYVKPEGKPESIGLRLHGRKLIVNNRGELEVKTQLGTVNFTKPLAYQENGKEREFIEVAYVVNGDEYGFKVGEYDRTKEIIIDPILAATFLGGTQADAADAIAFDNEGNLYVAGDTFSPDFLGTEIGSSTRERDAFIVKLDSGLSQILTAILIGGSGDEFDLDLELDDKGIIYLAGSTTSSDFPGIDTESTDSVHELLEAFVIKLNSDLNSIIAATFLGGSGADDGSAISLDNVGNVYVAGTTNSPDFPGIDTDSADNFINEEIEDEEVIFVQEVFIAKLDSSLNSIHAATFLGGSDIEYAPITAFFSDSMGNVFIAGFTDSSDFPGIGVQGVAADDSFDGFGEAFVAKLNSDLSSIVAATFLGGGGSNEGAFGITPDNTGDKVYVAGRTDSLDFPGIGAGSADNIFESGEAFVAKLDSDLSSIHAATFLGGSNSDEAWPITLDSSDNVYVAVFTDSPDFPGIDQKSADNVFDGFTEVSIAKLNPSLSQIIAATFLGGSAFDFIKTITLDSKDNLYVAGYTESSDFPGIGPGSADNTYEIIEAFVAKLDPNLSAARCGGFIATIVGTVGDDFLIGTDGPDVINGLDGNDTISGLRGNDIICGSRGNDTLKGGRGYDTILGGKGNDTLLGELGNDALKGEYDDDKLKGGNGTDTCAGGPHVNGDTATYCETITGIP